MPSQTEHSNNDQTSQTLTKVTPTLFIALGGTGREIALRVRRRILNYAWGNYEKPVRIDSIAQFPVAEFLYFDLVHDDSAIEFDRSAGTNPVEFTNDEKLIFNFYLDKYFNNEEDIDRDQTISSWFPDTVRHFMGYINTGDWRMAMVRSLSRLYFFDNYDHIKNKIELNPTTSLTDKI